MMMRGHFQIIVGNRMRDRAPLQQMTRLERYSAVVLTMLGVAVVVFAVLGGLRWLLFWDVK